MAGQRRQHYVPQFYLRRFGEANGRTTSLVRLSNGSLVEGAPIRRQAYENYLYGRDGIVEPALSRREQAFANAVDGVLRNLHVPAYGTDGHRELLQFVLCQLWRTPAGAEEVRQACISMEGADDLADWPPAAQLTRSLQWAAFSVPLVVDLRLTMIVNATSIEFVTSDTPVVRANPWIGEGRQRGLAQRGAIIVVPLSPEVTLLLYDAAVYAPSIPLLGDYFAFTDEAQVVELNQLQCMSAQRCVYFSGDPATGASLMQGYEQPVPTGPSWFTVRERFQTVPQPERAAMVRHNERWIADWVQAMRISMRRSMPDAIRMAMEHLAANPPDGSPE